MTPDELSERLLDDPAVADVALLVLHGSRARGDAHTTPDRDLFLRSWCDAGPVIRAAMNGVLDGLDRTVREDA